MQIVVSTVRARSAVLLHGTGACHSHLKILTFIHARSPQKISGKVGGQKKKKWISDATYAAIREKREAKGKDKKRYQELKAEVQRSSEWINSSSWKACA